MSSILIGVHADEKRGDMLGQRGGDGEFAPVQRRVPDPVEAGFVGQNLLPPRSFVRGWSR
jgi:hypothetical protein